MPITRPTYVTRQALAAALDVAPSASANARLDRAIVEGSKAVETLTRRVFYPVRDTRYFDYPAPGRSAPAYRIWLGADELISVESVTVAGEAVDVADVLLEPVNDGPPYTHLDIDQSTGTAWQAGQTWQRAVAVLGLYAGGPDDRETIGATAEALDASETDIDVTAAAGTGAGIGDVIIVGTERMLVTSFGWLTTGATASLTASAADQSITVADITAYADGELLLLGGERLQIQDRAGTTITVERAVQGTTLAAHTTETLYAARTLRVVRGVSGSTAAAHDTAATIERQVYPPAVTALALAEAEVQLQQQAGGYARPQGAGAGARPVASGTLEDVRARCEDEHRRWRQEAV